MAVSSGEPLSVPAHVAAPALERAAVDDRVSATARVVRNITALGFGQLLTWTSSTGLAIVLPRYLGDTNLGRLTLAQSFTGLFSLFVGLGTGAYLTKEVARRGAAAGSEVANSLLMRLPLAVLIGGLVALAASLLAYDSLTRQLIYLFWINTTLLGMASVLIGTLQGLQNMRPVALIDGLSKLFGLALTVLVVVVGWGVLGVGAIWLVSVSAMVAALLWVVLRHGALRGPIDYRSWMPLLLGGLPFLIWEVSLFTYGQIDVFLLSLFTRAEVIGWYGTAYRIVTIPVFIPTIIMAAVFPALAVAARRDREGFNEIASGALRIILVGTVPIALGILLLAEQLIDTLGYPSEFSRSVPLAMILAVHIPLMGADMVIGTALNSLDRQRQWAITAVVAALLNPAMNCALIPVTQSAYGNGAIGSATATVITEVFMLVMGLRLLQGQVFGRRDLVMAGKCLVAGALMAGPVWLARDLFLPFTVVLGAAVYGGAALALGLVSFDDVRRFRGYVLHRTRGGSASDVRAP